MWLHSLTLGILMIVSVLLLYLAAFVFFRREQIKYALLLILVAGGILRFYTASDPMLHKWDERYHALVAKNLMENPLKPMLYKEPLVEYDYKSWVGNSVWLHKQPLSLWLISSSVAVLGYDEIAVRLPSILAGILGIFLIFGIGKRLYNEKTGLLAAFLLSINGLVLDIGSGRSTTDHVDSLFMFWVLLAVYFFVRYQDRRHSWGLILGGLACGLAVLTKWLPALILFPIYLALVWQKRSLKTIIINLSLMFGTMILVALPWQIFASQVYPVEYAWESTYNFKHFTEGLENHGQAWWFFIDGIRIYINELIYLALIWFGVQTIRHRKQADIGLLLWIIIPLIVFSFAATKMRGYMLISFPAYMLVIANFWLMLAEKTKTVSLQWQKILFGLLQAATLILALRYGVERVKAFEPEVRQAAYEAKSELENLNLSPKAVVLNSPCPIEMMFYLDCIAYPMVPDVYLINRLSDLGYKLYVVERSLLPPEIREHPEVEVLRLEATTQFFSD
ncbi:MAG: ArnT family glycosyltransferase [Bacteroidia bacterium]